VTKVKEITEASTSVGLFLATPVHQAIMKSQQAARDVLWSGHRKVVELSEQGFIQSIGN